MFARCLLVAVLFFQMSFALEAQYFQPNNGPMTPTMQKQQRMQQKMMQQGMQQAMQQGVPFEASGTLTAIGGGHLKMVDSSGVEKIIVVNQQTAIKTTGEAGADFIKPGMLVAFKAEFDSKGAISGKVEELAVISVSKENTPGVFSESGEAIKPGTASKAKKGATVSQKVVGHLKASKDGKYQVQAGRSNLSFEVSDSAKVSIDMSDGSLASKGDKVEVKGVQSPAAPNQGQAESVTLTLADTAGDKKKSSTGKTDSKLPPKASKPKNPEKTGGLPAPAKDR